MGKKNNHHSIHLSAEVEALVRANMESMGVETLNGYIALVIRDHALFLRVCALASRMADNWREVLRIEKEEKER